MILPSHTRTEHLRLSQECQHNLNKHNMDLAPAHGLSLLNIKRMLGNMQGRQWLTQRGLKGVKGLLGRHRSQPSFLMVNTMRRNMVNTVCRP